jgi:hypothetical protein
MENQAMTMDELREAGDRLLIAAQEYWVAAHKAGISGAVIWLEDRDKGLVIFTRGEYRATILRNIHEIGPARVFGAVDEA